jgi:hypothetical protein
MMEIKKGTLLNVKHSRKGRFLGIAREDFDTDKEEWYPINVAGGNKANGVSEFWNAGDEIPCRKDFTKVEVISDGKNS